MKVLVTGGGGFLGKEVCRQLRERGDEVVSISRSDYPELAEMGVDHRRGDLASAEDVAAAAEGCEAIIHTAALPGIWGPRESYWKTNVVGTENVIAACRRHGIRKLVNTSSPSVVADGTDLDGVDESYPYPSSFKAHYPETKAIAEQKVTAANDDELATVSLRPHIIWGPGDHHILPRLVRRARQGKLRRIGSLDKPVDTITVRNAAHAHLLALDKLEPGSAVAGKLYFVSQDEPIGCWTMIDRMLEAAGEAPIQRSIPAGVAYAAGALLELVWTVTRRSGEPPMTRFLAVEFSTSHWFDIGAAKRDLGYEPLETIDEGLVAVREWVKAHPIV